MAVGNESPLSSSAKAAAFAETSAASGCTRVEAFSEDATIQ
jgi:hypothetical protein